MSGSTESLWPFFLAVLLTVAILLTAVVGAMLLGRRRLADTHQQYARRLLVVQDQERAHLAREVHGEMNQRVAALAFDLSNWGTTPPADRVAAAAAELGSLGSDLRAMAHRLHPKAAEGLGLGLALHEFQRELKQQFQFQLGLQVIGEPMPKGDLAQNLFRIVQEALNNIRTHTDLRRAEVRVEAHEDGVLVEIEDAGPGFDQTTTRGQGQEGLGLISMRERAALVGGTLTIRSHLGSGTLIRVRVPILASTSG